MGEVGEPLALRLMGRVPSKKNAWRRAPGQKAYLPSQVQADIDALVIQARCQWNARAASAVAVGPEGVAVRMRFHTWRSRSDLDNLVTTVLDVLQKARVIDDDRYVRRIDAEVSDAPTSYEQRVEVEIAARYH